MKKRLFVIVSAVLLAALLLLSFSAFAEEEKLTETVPFEVTEDDLVIEKKPSQKKEDLTEKFLTIKPEVTTAFSTVLMRNIKTNFNNIYPVLAEKFNHGVMWDIIYTIDDNNDYAAYQIGGRTESEKIIAMNSKFFKQNPSDVSCLSHELTHAMQRYPDAKYGAASTANGGPWIMEGIADYSRYVYEPTPFDLPAFSKSQSYTDAYRVTARFFLWCDQNIDPTFLEQLNEGLRSEVYTQKLFVKITGKTIDELWQLYAESDHKIK